MKLIKSSALIGALTLISRVLGLIRDTLLAKYLGAGVVTDTLITAFKIPNTFRRIFAEGAFSAAFVPLYARRIEEEGEQAADGFASESLAALFVLVASLVIAFELTMPWTLNLFGIGLNRESVDPGADFPANLAPYDLAVLCAQITMPYLLLISLISVFSGILNTRHHFAIAAFTPAMLNVVLVTVLALTANADWSKAMLSVFLCIGMTASGILQISMVFWACRKAGVKIGLKRPRLTPGVRRLFVLGIPGILAAGVMHINIMVSHSIATLKDSAASWLYWADRLYQLPLSIIGIAIGIALLPALSRRLRSQDSQGAKTSLNRALEIAAFLTLPAAAALAAIPEFLVSGLFERGEFDTVDTVATALALRMFALGLPAFVLIKVLTPVFFAREDTKTPMIYASISAGLNLALGFVLFLTLGFWGLAVATSISGWINVVLLVRILVASGYLSPDTRLLSRLPRILIASLIMAGFVWWSGQYAMPSLTSGYLKNYLLLGLVSGAGLVMYALAALALKAYGFADIKYVLDKN